MSKGVVVWHSGDGAHEKFVEPFGVQGEVSQPLLSLGRASEGRGHR